MERLKWTSVEVKPRKELGENYWHQGFFWNSEVFDGFYRRDFSELMQRDISLFTLGELKDKTILDIGCGSGLYTLTFLKLGAKRVAAQDLSEEAIIKTEEDCKKNNFTNFDFRVGDCQKLQFDDNVFDIAFSGDVFEHITDQQKLNFMLEAYRVLKPGGFFTIKTPNRDYLKMTTGIRRLKAIVRFQNPFKIHIPLTHNNPSNEHHGLINASGLIGISKETMFHYPKITFTNEYKNEVPSFIKKYFKKSRYFNPTLILTVRKPYFHGLYN